MCSNYGQTHSTVLSYADVCKGGGGGSYTLRGKRQNYGISNKKSRKGFIFLVTACKPRADVVQSLLHLRAHQHQPPIIVLRLNRNISDERYHLNTTLKVSDRLPVHIFVSSEGICLHLGTWFDQPGLTNTIFEHYQPNLRASNQGP